MVRTWMLWQNGRCLGGRYQISWLGHGCSGKTDGVWAGGRYQHGCSVAIRKYVHTYIHTYIHTDIQTYRHTDIHTYIHTYIHTNPKLRGSRTWAGGGAEEELRVAKRPGQSPVVSRSSRSLRIRSTVVLFGICRSCGGGSSCSSGSSSSSSGSSSGSSSRRRSSSSSNRNSSRNRSSSSCSGRHKESAIIAAVLTAELAPSCEVVLSGLKVCEEVSLECRCCICAQNLPSDASAMPACHRCFNTPWAQWRKHRSNVSISAELGAVV